LAISGSGSDGEKNNWTKKEYTAQRRLPRPSSTSSAAAIAAFSTVAVALPPSHTGIAATATMGRHIPGVLFSLPSCAGQSWNFS
jgi:hypothetical protein